MLYRLKENFYNVMAKQDEEFLQNKGRLYYLIRNVNYKGERINVAVPLRANININYQTNKEEYIGTPATEHTQAGKMAGWHITKMIPVVYNNLIAVRKLNKSLQLAEMVAKTYLQKMCNGIKKILCKLEKGEKVFGAINFDEALTIVKKQETEKNKCSEKKCATKNMSKQKEIAVSSLVNKQEKRKETKAERFAKFCASPDSKIKRDKLIEDLRNSKKSKYDLDKDR